MSTNLTSTFKTFIYIASFAFMLSLSSAYANDSISNKPSRIHSATDDIITPASYREPPDFSFWDRISYNLPPCSCNEQGEPLSNCDTQKINMFTHIIIDEQGKPQSIDLVEKSDYPHLNRKTIEAFQKTRFNPYFKNNEPIPSVIFIPVEFQYEPRMEAICRTRRQALLQP